MDLSADSFSTIIVFQLVCRCIPEKKHSLSTQCLRCSHMHQQLTCIHGFSIMGFREVERPGPHSTMAFIVYHVDRLIMLENLTVPDSDIRRNIQTGQHGQASLTALSLLSASTC